MPSKLTWPISTAENITGDDTAQDGDELDPALAEHGGNQGDRQRIPPGVSAVVAGTTCSPPARPMAMLQSYLEPPTGRSP